MKEDGAALRARYRRYNEVCNRHAFNEITEFVDDDVWVNGEPTGLTAYQAGLAAVVAAFPDYRWQLKHLLVDGSWVAAHFIDSGTHRGPWRHLPPTGRRIRTQEFAVYRFEQERIAEVWGTADNLSGLEQLRADGEERH